MNTGLAAALAAVAIGGVLAIGLTVGGGDDGPGGIPAGALQVDIDDRGGSEVVTESSADAAVDAEDAGGADGGANGNSDGNGRGDNGANPDAVGDPIFATGCRVAGEVDGDDFDFDEWVQCSITPIDTFLQALWIREGVTIGMEIADFDGGPGDYMGFVTLAGAPNADSFYGGECTIRVEDFNANAGQGMLRASARNCSPIPTVADEVAISIFLVEP